MALCETCGHDVDQKKAHVTVGDVPADGEPDLRLFWHAEGGCYTGEGVEALAP